MQYLKKAVLLLFVLALSAPTALALNTLPTFYGPYDGPAGSYVEDPYTGYDHYDVPEVEEDPYPQAVDNSGTFGMSVEDFRDLCEDTDGEWDVVNGRHVCYCWEGDFLYPEGCPEVDYWDEWEDEDDYYDDYYDDWYYDDDRWDYDDRYYPRPDYPFYDLAGHPDEYYVLKLVDLGIIDGYPDGSFKPDQPVTRAEMVKMAMKAAKVEPIPGDEDRNRFFADLDNWQAPWVNAAYRLDIVEGFSGYNSGVRLYKPNVWVNRVEGVKLVLASFGRLPLDLEKTSFVDAEGWMVPWLEDAFRIGLIDRDYTGRFYPAEPMTRGMAARVIVKMLQYAGDI